MKKLKWILPALLVLSAVVVATTGACIKYLILEPLGIHREESIVAIPFVLCTDEALQFMIDMKTQSLRAPENPSEEVQQSTVPSDVELTEPAETEPATTEPVYVELDESWFDDALFIGDSRTMGLRNCYRLGKAEYFATIGMNVYNVFIDWSSDNNFEKMSLESLLQKHSYGKILIGIGINECDYPYDYIMEGFQRLIDLIHQHQPDAKIILQSIMTVSERQTRVAECYSLENLGKINEGIRSFANGENVFYIDVNEWIADENGYLPEEMTGDGIHLYGSGYKEFALWLMDACGYLGIP